MAKGGDFNGLVPDSEYAIIVKKRGEQMSVKERILQSAEELIYQKGYDATSISDIMEVADVGKGQLYYYGSSEYIVELLS
nr:TetR/AcrR family transcriptional regulator [Rothia dentocariosa]